jgi:citrate synthase
MMSKPFWRTSLSAVEPNKILIRGYRVQDLMAHCSFGEPSGEIIRGRLPNLPILPALLAK